MKPLFETARIPADAAWPESWRVSHHHDDVEIWGSPGNPPYAKAYHQRMERVLAALREVTPPGGRVLDLAAAQGNFTLSAAALGYRVTWNDFRGDLVDYVKLKSPLAGQIAFVPGNILELGERFHHAFDTVLALEVIEHVAHPDEFLAALATLVAPGGHLILSTPNGGYFRNPLPRFSDFPDPSVFESEQFKPDSDGHIFLLHEDEIRSLAGKAGLRVVRHELMTNILSAGFVKTGVLHRVLPGGLIDAIECVTRKLPGPLSRAVNTGSVTVLTPGAA